MDNLTTRQIEEFINPLAFARPRDARVGQTSVDDSRTSRLQTGDIEESYRLVLGAEDRLETLAGNLQTMLSLTKEGQSARGDDRKLEEIYGKLRSLSAGFDQVVDAIQFDGQTVFTGEKAYLNMGPGTQLFELNVANLHTYGDGSLDLSQAQATAKATISYKTEDRILNAGYDIIGLDIEEASFIQGSNPALELENGDYKVAISYAGDNSTVKITNTDGSLIETREGVDLSGSGREWVDFDIGLRLTFEKESLFTSFDKYDYETNGPAELSASLTYERVEGHVLRTREVPDEESISFLYDPILSSDTGSLSLSSPEFAPVDPDSQGLDSGQYSLEIEYHGENSIVRVSDTFGRLKAFDYEVDLSGDGSHEVDLGVGFTFTVDTDSFSREGASITVPIKIEKQGPPLNDFDLRIYIEQIEKAITIIEEQQRQIAEAKDRILEVNELRNSANTSGVPSTLALNTSGALSILTGGGENSYFRPASSQARFNTLSTQLFAATTALPTQANQTPQQLASLQNTASINSWLGTFS